MVFLVIRSASFAWSDYAGYYYGSRELLKGNYLTVYDTQSLNALILEQSHKSVFVSYAPFPPFTSLLFLPFTIMSIEFSKLIFNILSCCLFLLTLWRSFKYFAIPNIFWLFVPIIFLTPLRNNIFFGQAYLLLFSLLMEGYMAYKKDKLILSSFLWGIAIVFKVFPIVIFLFLIFRKNYKAVFYLCFTCLFLLIFSLLINGFAPWQLYFLKIFPRLNNGELNDSYTYMFQSAFMLFKNIFVYDKLMNPYAFLNNPYLFLGIMAIFKAFVISVCIVITIRQKSNDFLSFAMWMAGSMLISPNGSIYSLILLLIPFLALLNYQVNRTQQVIVILLLLLICNIPVHYFSSFPVLLKFPRLYFFIAFFIMLFVFAQVKYNYMVLLVVFCLFLGLDAFKLFNKPDNSSYLFSKDEYALIYDYKIKNNKLICYYWSEEGGKEILTDYIVKKSNTKDLYLKDNQIYYKGKKLTDSPDWKRKPLLLDGTYIVYLSDKNRGVGFYTLRKLKLS